MQIIKNLIRYPFNLFGLQIVNIAVCNAQQISISEIILTANNFNNESLQNRLDILSDSEYLQFLVIKYGYYVTDFLVTIKLDEDRRFFVGNHSGESDECLLS